MKNEQQVLLLNLLLSGLFGVAFVMAATWTHSSAALGQGSDSLNDAVLGGLLLGSLLYSNFVFKQQSHAASQSVEARSRLTKQRAGALRLERFISAFVGVVVVALACEVFHESIEALFQAKHVVFQLPLLAWFLMKVSFKYLLMRNARGMNRPALRAFCLDAKSDILVGLVSALSYLFTYFSIERVDSIVGLAAALWILKNGVQLIVENLFTASKRVSF